MHRRRHLTLAVLAPRIRMRSAALAARALIALACALIAAVPARHPTAATPARYPGLFENVTADLGVFWAGQFSAAGLAYADPGVQIVGTTVSSGCGPMSASSIGAYCPADRTIYLSGPAGNDLISQYGNFAWVVVVSHEWGHHIQHLLAIEPGTGPDFELQADCLAGAYAKDAEARGLLADNDLVDGVNVSASAGDPPWLPKDSPGAHGTNDQRVKALMTGDINGVGACGIAQLGSVVAMPQPANPAPAPPAAAGRAASSYLPGGPAVADGACFTVSAQGAYPAADVDAFLAGAGAGPGAARTLQWLDGAYIDFRCPSPPPGMASFLEVVVHRFGSPAAASQAAGYWQAGHAPQANEVYRCVSQGALVVCADGIAAAGPPVDEVNTLLQQVLAAAG